MTDADIVLEFIQRRMPSPPESGFGALGAATRLKASLDELEALRDAAEWLIANRGHRGEAQAWKLLADALAKEPT